MAGIPRRQEIIRDLQGQSQQLQGAELFLAGQLSERIARSEEATNAANAAAAAAQTAAAGAQAQATYIQDTLVPGVLGVANNAQTAANAANAAAANAQNRASVLEMTRVWRQDGTTSEPTLSGSYATLAEMSMTVDWGGYPLVVMFSGEFYNTAATGAVMGDVVIVSDGVQQTNSRRGFQIPYPGFSVGVSVIYSVTPPAGGGRNVQVQARATQGAGSVRAVLTYRELVIVRLPFSTG